MKVVVKYKNDLKEFENKTSITIGSLDGSDFVLSEIEDKFSVTMAFVPKYQKYVLINVSENGDILYNGQSFTKVLVDKTFVLSIKKVSEPIFITVEYNAQTQDDLVTQSTAGIFSSEVENARVRIIQEIGASVMELKENMLSVFSFLFLLNAITVLLSVVSAFGVTNFMLGFSISNGTSGLNLSTNYGFLIGFSLMILTISMMLKHSVFLYFRVENAKSKNKKVDSPHSFLFTVSCLFFFLIYILNIMYYNQIPNFVFFSFLVSLFFVGGLAAVSIAAGYMKNQYNINKKNLINIEYRADLEGVMRNYRAQIENYIANLSDRKIDAIKNALLNEQLRSIVETFIGILTAPFLAYGVSNTLASCFPEAANWVRISGLRFSPIFLVLATFLIVFAFFAFTRAFTITKQINGSEIIKFDGFTDFSYHGCNILGVDGVRNLTREKVITLTIACIIILIEFTMNVSYFISEIGSDPQGFFLSCVTALVPTALLIAETTLLSSTYYKIGNYNNLLIRIS